MLPETNPASEFPVPEVPVPAGPVGAGPVPSLSLLGERSLTASARGHRVLAYQKAQKRKFGEFADLQDNRVTIQRLLHFQDLELERRRRNARKKTSRHHRVDENGDYIPMVPMEEGEDPKEWVGKERSALRRDREKQRAQNLARGDEQMHVKVAQVARGSGQPIVINDIPVPDYVEELNHKRRRRRR